ncbi:MAG: hypothetical protein LUI13_15055 [Lachnospiraceae bacterium]|nr:hypothetical protein [Lachnospiraceae bacterium]
MLQCSYARGKISILTIPDDMGDLYHYPAEVLNVIRRTVCHGMPAVLEGPAGIQMFAYDNNRIILRSDLDYTCEVTLRLSDEIRAVQESGSGREYAVTDHKVTLALRSAVNVMLELESPFEISADSFYSDGNMAHLRRGVAALNTGEGIEHELIEE